MVWCEGEGRDEVIEQRRVQMDDILYLCSPVVLYIT